MAGVAPDANVAGFNLSDQAGAVCFADGPPAFTLIDCMSYGAYTGMNPPAAELGTPAAATPFGSTLERTIAPNCPTLLEGADDTNNSAADFALSTSPPRNNSAVPIETPCPAAATPTPTPTPTPTQAPAFNLKAAIKKCKKKFPKGPKRKKCIRKARQRAAAA